LLLDVEPEDWAGAVLVVGTLKTSKIVRVIEETEVRGGLAAIGREAGRRSAGNDGAAHEIPVEPQTTVTRVTSVATMVEYSSPEGASGPQGGRFLVSARDGVVRDAETGLAWQRKGPPADMTWQDARTAAKAFGEGATGSWRLPTRKELLALAAASPYWGGSPPFADAATGWFWCDSKWSDDLDFAWAVSFTFHEERPCLASSRFRVRFVREPK